MPRSRIRAVAESSWFFTSLMVAAGAAGWFLNHDGAAFVLAPLFAAVSAWVVLSWLVLRGRGSCAGGACAIAPSGDAEEPTAEPPERVRRFLARYGATLPVALLLGVALGVWLENDFPWVVLTAPLGLVVGFMLWVTVICAVLDRIAPRATRPDAPPE
ncbi:MAG: hypothetical protein ACT4P1_15290 [Sporichthyaceae bacterium]